MFQPTPLTCEAPATQSTLFRVCTAYLDTTQCHAGQHMSLLPAILNPALTWTESTGGESCNGSSTPSDRQRSYGSPSPCVSFGCMYKYEYLS